MKDSELLRKSFFNALMFVALLWCIKSAELLFHFNWLSFGVMPLSPFGLVGILLAPLLHGSIAHIASNSVAVLVLGTALLYGYPRTCWRVLAIIWLLSGIGVWLFARPAYHIGASGLTHGLFFFLLIASILRRDKRSIGLMMVAFLLFGSMLLTILPTEPNISFEYHLFGALAGSLCAFIYWRSDPKPTEKIYSWEQEPEQDEGFDWWLGSELASDNKAPALTCSADQHGMATEATLLAAEFEAQSEQHERLLTPVLQQTLHWQAASLRAKANDLVAGCGIRSAFSDASLISQSCERLAVVCPDLAARAQRFHQRYASYIARI